MQKPIYVHYGSTFFEPSRNFPISNHRNWSKPFGGLWASRQDATFGWKDWCEREEFRMRIILLNFSYVIIQKLPLFIV